MLSSFKNYIQYMKSLRSFIANQELLDTHYEGYRSYALDPLIPIRSHVSSE